MNCPLCEHPHTLGDTCDNCGKQLLTRPSTLGATVSPIAELEANVHPKGEAPVSVERLPDLEVTRQGAGPDLPTVELPDLERTGLSVGAVTTVPLADLDLGRTIDTDPKTAVSEGPVTCRYCRSVQAEGLLCEKCGMRLPRFRSIAAAAPRSTEEVFVRCSCGVSARAGDRCTSCGLEAAFPIP